MEKDENLKNVKSKIENEKNKKVKVQNKHGYSLVNIFCATNHIQRSG